MIVDSCYSLRAQKSYLISRPPVIHLSQPQQGTCQKDHQEDVSIKIYRRDERMAWLKSDRASLWASFPQV